MQTLNWKRSAAVLVALLIVVSAGACAKRRTDESAEAFRKREIAVAGAQAMTGLEAWSDLTEQARTDNRLNDGAARASYVINEQTRKGLQVARDYLREGKAQDAIGEIEKAIAALQRAEAEGIFNSPQFREGANIARFALNSLRAILKGLPRPAAPSRDRAVTDAILIVQQALLHAFEQSQYDEASAWADGDALNARLQGKNTIRLQR